MNDRVAFTSVHFSNFKAFAEFFVTLREMNILVGPNNCGKSTIISAFRVLAAALRKASSRAPEFVPTPKGRRAGYRISEVLPISMENVHTENSDGDSAVTFRLSNKNQLALYFPADGGCMLVPETTGRVIRTAADFRRAFPVTVGVVPVLGPLEHEEVVVSEETVRLNLYTHRASRHFRNYWYYNRGGFDKFATMVGQTWPGVRIYLPSRSDGVSNKLVMVCEEEGRPRELFWAGFGFQVWSQLLTHIVRSATRTLLIVDEPEVYLHPDLQRQLLIILRAAGPDILMASHATDIIAEAEPSDLLLVDKKKRAAQRIKDISEVQAALDRIGSLQNIELTQLARNRRVVFVESSADFRLVRRFARRLGFEATAAGLGLTAIESEGASSWIRIKHVAEGIEQTLGSPLRVAAIYDRDYRSEEEIASIRAALEPHLSFLHFHQRKEMENYLLCTVALDRALATAIRERAKRLEQTISIVKSIGEMLSGITELLKQDIQAQYVAKRTEFLRHSGRDAATLAAETMRWFEERWRDREARLALIPGKQVLRELREEVQRIYGVSLTDQRIVDAFHVEEIDTELRSLIEEMERFGIPEGI